ncbi:flagellar associated protein [Scenedesmus sp. NREL 46B-D3]|nr:flagellar associated protein [Scenedesmus sp. NREL 46B-D3]
MAERNFYLDNLKASQIHETISKEKKIQRQYFEKEAAAGRLTTWVPPKEEPHTTLLQTVGLPGFTGTYKQDAELSVATTMSKNMWTSNPGYVLRDGAHMASSTHKDFVWDEDAVAFMKAQGEFNKQFHKRRDEFVMYVEAAARAHHQLGSRPPAGASSSK